MNKLYHTRSILSRIKREKNQKNLLFFKVFAFKKSGGARVEKEDSEKRVFDLKILPFY